MKSLAYYFEAVKRKALTIILYGNYKLTGKDFHLTGNIMSIDETISFASIKNNSIVRFGDGEFNLIAGIPISNYQSVNPQLSEKLESILNSDNKNLLICMPEPVLKGVDEYRKISQKHWIYHLHCNRKLYARFVKENIYYGNSFISRPYMIYSDKSKCKKWFEQIKKIFEERNIVIIEGKFSRSGVGNDIFSGAKSLKRILCPSQNAFDKYGKILKEARNISKDTLILIALGPCGKVLTADLAKIGYWVLDIGHLDSEYEWYLKKCNDRVSISGKHTAEIKDNNIEECKNIDYQNSIISIIE